MMTNDNLHKTVKCPTCKKPVEWSAGNPWRPFCSKRCRLIDLGEWADEGYSIPLVSGPDFNNEDNNRDD